MSIDIYKKESWMMNLNKLIESRERVSTKEFTIPAKELLSRFEQLYTGEVNDLLREFCLLE
jgi:4-hydroxy-4-methyl-2-oxoglutarate aldolase